MKFKQHKEKKGKRGPEKGRGREGKEERKREEGREGEREVKKEGREREMEKPQPMNYSQYFPNKIFTLVNPWWLSDKESTCNAGDMGQEDLLEKEMATRSSILAWEISRMEEPCGLQSVGIARVRQDSD